MKLKTLAIVGAVTFAVQAAFAQNMPPNEGNLPSLRTPTPLRAQIDRNMQPSLRTSSAAKRDEDVAKVVPVKCTKPTGKFPWNFDKVKVTDIVDQISRLTCRNFIISSAVKPTQDLTIMSRTPVDVDQAWQAFLSALESNNLALVQVGSYYKIVGRTDSIKQSIPLYEKGDTLPNNEGMITLLYDVRNISKEVAQSLVKGLISKSGDVLVVGEAYLVVSDSSSNIRRVMHILEKVDVPGAANRLHIVDLAHASSPEIKTKIDEIFDAKSSTSNQNRMLSAAARADRIRSGLGDMGTGGESYSVQKIIADERTNKLIVIASDKAYARIKEVIELLDVPSSDSSSQGQINVYYLKNSDAKKLATTLSSLIQGTQNTPRTGAMARPGAFRPEQEAALFEGELKVTADESTNSLVIIGSPRDYKALSQVIDKLDRQRTQVYVEAAIMDVSLKDSKDYGVTAYSGLQLPPIPGLAPKGGLAVPATGGGQSLAASAIAPAVTALTTTGASAATAGLAGIPAFFDSKNLLSVMGFAGVNLFGGTEVTIPSLGVILKALQNSSDVDVLSTPSLMTLDNEKAEISVGENIPTASGISSVGTAGTAALIPLQQVTRLDVKLKFGITPHVNDSDAVRLEIDQDVNELGDVVLIGNSPNFSIRNKSAKTVVVAKDQQTVVIGGLISNRTSNTEVKTPWLGDIPVIGHLFKTTHKEKEKKNLLLVLTPYIIRGDADLKKIYDRKMKDREDFGKLYFGDRISKYNPQIDYDKKTGPLANVVRKVEFGMLKVENGGPGLPGETVVKPEKTQTSDRKLDITVPDATPAPEPMPLTPNQGIRPELEDLDEDFIDDSEPPRNNNSGMMPPGTATPPVEPPPPAPAPQG